MSVVDRLSADEDRKRRARRTRTIAIWVTRVLTLVISLGAWEAASRTERIDPLFFSSPSQVVNFLVASVPSEVFWVNVGVTLRETLLGLVIGSLGGVLVGLLFAEFSFLRDTYTPFMTLFNSLPRVALAPMFIIWFGIGETSKVVLAVSLVFFIVMVNAESGARSADIEHLSAVRSMGATRLQVFTKVMWPAALPSILSSMRLAVVYALLGAVVGEMLAAQRGIGQQIQYNATTFNTAGVLGLLLTLASIALILNAIVLLIERRMLGWRV
ncbi:ABC transporter permease [Dactylosporangium roseum]|uniref:ABC transporter permease n=1 Tax=Dactylosporangium roseum TaxID=47989 RepID=A0ABY5YXI9_9ACTN|nr:ABC transporter permease [Dactylosporangium roseum]UWZ34476.1 ABC transporter permease [Dactylosporangium roseum]